MLPMQRRASTTSQKAGSSHNSLKQPFWNKVRPGCLQAMSPKRCSALAQASTLKRAIALVQLKTQTMSLRRTPRRHPSSQHPRRSVPCDTTDIADGEERIGIDEFRKPAGRREAASESASESSVERADDFPQGHRQEYTARTIGSERVGRSSFSNTWCNRTRGALTNKPSRCSRTGHGRTAVGCDARTKTMAYSETWTSFRGDQQESLRRCCIEHQSSRASELRNYHERGASLPSRRVVKSWRLLISPEERGTPTKTEIFSDSVPFDALYSLLSKTALHTLKR